MRRLSTFLAAICLSAAPALADEVTIRAISAWPTTFGFTQQFSVFIKRVNEEGKGVVQIKLVGGPEVTPAQQQDMAIRNGIFDMQLGAAAYYAGSLPEGAALRGATVTPVEARHAGTADLLDKIWREKLNAHFVAWQSGGLGFYVYLADEPKFKDGQLDLTGVSMRSAAAYNEWFQTLGGTNVVMPAPEVYSAFQRGMIKGLGWSALGFPDLGITDFIKYRVSPGVFQIDIVIMMNADKWDSLSKEAQDIITRVAVAHEREVEESSKVAAAKEAEALQAAGIKFVELTGADAEKYKTVAHDIAWKQLEASSPTHVTELRAALYKK